MNDLGEALGWKYQHEPGISTVNGQLTAWPETLGRMPTQDEIDLIMTEYAKHQAALKNIEELETLPRRVRERLLVLGDQYAIDEETAIAAERAKL